jgi:hypothetical protein
VATREKRVLLFWKTKEFLANHNCQRMNLGRDFQNLLKIVLPWNRALIIVLPFTLGGA